MQRFFPAFLGGAPSVGLFFLRLVAGTALIFHGLTKMQHPLGPMSWMGPASPFPGFLQFLAAFSEFCGGFALIIGLLTPLASLGILCTMFVACLTQIQRGAPFVGKGSSWEAASLFFAIATTLILVGPGVLSLDARLFGRNKK